MRTGRQNNRRGQYMQGTSPRFLLRCGGVVCSGSQAHGTEAWPTGGYVSTREPAALLPMTEVRGASTSPSVRGVCSVKYSHLKAGSLEPDSTAIPHTSRGARLWLRGPFHQGHLTTAPLPPSLAR